MDLTEAIVNARLEKDVDMEGLFERIVAAEPNDKAGARQLCEELRKELRLYHR